MTTSIMIMVKLQQLPSLYRFDRLTHDVKRQAVQSNIVPRPAKCVHTMYIRTMLKLYLSTTHLPVRIKYADRKYLDLFFKCKLISRFIFSFYRQGQTSLNTWMDSCQKGGNHLSWPLAHRKRQHNILLWLRAVPLSKTAF